MWDQVIIFVGMRPHLITCTPIALALVIRLARPRKSVCRLITISGILASLLVAIFLHLRWDSFAIHWKSLPTLEPRNGKLLFVGDSITKEGTRPKGFITKIRAHTGFDAQILALPGGSTQEILHMLAKTPKEEAPITIILQAGVNDRLERTPFKETMENWSQLQTRLRERHPDSLLVTLPVHPVRVPASSLPSEASHPAKLPSSLSPWWENDETFLREDLVADGIHLNSKGHTALATALIIHLSKLERNAQDS